MSRENMELGKWRKDLVARGKRGFRQKATDTSNLKRRTSRSHRPPLTGAKGEH
jgi:hypothetical protein